jgi:uncharacterized membrane protein YccC
VIKRETVVPDWLAEVVRPKPAPPPWPAMLRAALAICVPLAIGMATGHRTLGLLPAMGGLIGVMVDLGGPYLLRVRRVGAAVLFGGAPGLVIGEVIHGHGWITVLALVLVAGVSAAMSTLGDIGSVTGLQLLVYASLGLGPLGTLRPWWPQAVEFVIGGLWALVLIVPGWLLEPRSAEQRAVANVYHALARELRAIGTPRAVTARNDVTAALNTGYDMLLTSRAFSAGRSRSRMRLIAVLNVSHLVAEATITLRSERRKPPALVTATLDRLADAAAGDGPVPLIPPPWGTSPGTRALRDSLVRLASLLSGGGYADQAPAPRPSMRDRLESAADQFRVGAIGQTFTIRLMACIGVAAYLSEVLAVQRSYWVVLTTAIVLKPDYGSVFARALQRGIGTIVGAVVGAAILALVPYGPWLLVPFGILAALLPYGRARNFGLSATFLTPLVVLLIDILEHTGWRLAEARLLDTVLGCAVVLVVGYLPWPMSWHAHLPGKLASTMRAVAAYLEESLSDPSVSGTFPVVSDSAPPPGQRARMRRRTYRAISDLRAEFQRVMSEPAAVSRRASALWPAVVGLEDVTDATTALAVAVKRGAPAPSADAVRQLARSLTAVADALDSGSPPSAENEPLPSDEALRPVIDAVRTVFSVLTPKDGRAGRIRTGDLRDPNAAR